MSQEKKTEIKRYAYAKITKKKFNPDQDQHALLVTSIVGNDHCTTKENKPFFPASVLMCLETFSKTTVLLVDEPNIFNLQGSNPNSSNEELENKLQELLTRWWDDNESGLLAFIPGNHQDALEFRTTKCSKRTESIKTIGFKDSSLINHSTPLTGTVGERIAQFNQLAEENNIPIKVVCWKDFCENANPDIKKKALEDCNNETSGVYTCIDQFSREYSGRGNKSDLPKTREISQSYLKEEVIGFLGVGINKEFNYFIYPGKMSWLKPAFDEAFGENRNFMQILSIQHQRIAPSGLEPVEQIKQSIQSPTFSFWNLKNRKDTKKEEIVSTLNGLIERLFDFIEEKNIPLQAKLLYLTELQGATNELQKKILKSSPDINNKNESNQLITMVRQNI